MSEPLNSEQKRFVDLCVFVSESCFSLRAGRCRLLLVLQSLIILCLQTSFSRRRTSEVKACSLRKSSSCILLHTWSWVILSWKEACYQQGCIWDVSRTESKLSCQISRWPSDREWIPQSAGSESIVRKHTNTRECFLGCCRSERRRLSCWCSRSCRRWRFPPSDLTHLLLGTVQQCILNWSPQHKQRCDMQENTIKQDEREERSSLGTEIWVLRWNPPSDLSPLQWEAVVSSGETVKLFPVLWFVSKWFYYLKQSVTERIQKPLWESVF